MTELPTPSGNVHDRLSAKEYTANAFQAILKAVPYIGSTIEQFIFGPAAELRWQRIDRTLQEVAAELRRTGRPVHVDTEQYAALLENAAGQIARATNDDERERLRDLLVNGAETPGSSKQWDDIELARDLLARISGPGLAILAALGREPLAGIQEGGRGSPEINLVSLPQPQFVLGPFDWEKPQLLGTVVRYEWAVVEEWMHRLREMRLVGYQSSDARGGFGAVRMTGLGRLLVRWSLREDVTDT